MFFLSKLVWIVGQPLSLAFLFGLFGIAFGLLKRPRIALASGILSTSILFIALFTTVGAVFVQDLEDRFPRAKDDPSDLTCMIVLGGGFDNDVDTFRGGYNLNAGGERFVEVVRLARKFPRARVLVSGGDGSIAQDYLGDAVISERMFADFGIDHDRIVKEETSKTTFENAINTKEHLRSNGLSDCLLITSGFHMPRSVGIFRKLDIPVTPWTVDYRTTGRESLRLDLTQPFVNADLLSVAAKEGIGLVGYYLVGRTSALYPGEE